MKLHVYIDGACEPQNPGGAMGMGVWCEELGLALKQAVPASPENSNNVAEYRALLLALEYLHPWRRAEIVIWSDSQLLVGQMRGDWQVHEGGLYVPWYLKAREKANSFRRLLFLWLRREANEEADRLSRQALLELEMGKQTC